MRRIAYVIVLVLIAITEVSIFDLYGRAYQVDCKLEKESCGLDLSQFQSGIYHVKIRFADESEETKKFVIY